MKISRLFSDENGDSHFKEIEVELNDAGEIGRLSQQFPVDKIIFRENDGNYNFDFHNSPQRQFIVLLDGEIQIETSLGVKRNFKAGEILLVEDTIGKGHKTKSIDGKLRRSIFITIGDENVKFE